MLKNYVFQRGTTAWQCIVLIYVLGVSPSTLQAQQHPKFPASVPLQGTLPGLQAVLEPQASGIRFNTQFTAREKIDTETGVVRAMYRLNWKPGDDTFTDPGQTAMGFLADQSERLGLAGSLDDLVEIDRVSGIYSHHILYQQQYRDVPVYGRFIKVNMNPQGAVTMVSNGYADRLREESDLDIKPTLSAREALEMLQNHLSHSFHAPLEPELMVYAGVPARLVWKWVVYTQNPDLEFEVLIDAHTGKAVSVLQTSTHVQGHSETFFEPTQVKGERGFVQHEHEETSFAVRQVSGSGFVFDPDPLSSSGMMYGGAYADNNDVDIAQVNDERRLVELLDITQGSDGFFRLSGPHVDIVGENASGINVYTVPSELSSDEFRYTRSNPFFEAVNVYYHIDKSQRHIQSLGIGRDILNLPVPVNPHGLGSVDNSRYFPNQSFIAFGLGGVDDAEDAHVVWHEYGHALLDASAPGLISISESKALHEGWADYWAASYARSLVESNESVRSDWANLFKWDSGDGDIWAGRSLDFAGKYPEDVFCDDGGIQCDIHGDGLLWATTLMEVYDVLGRHETDRLAIASHIYLAFPATFRDAAEAVVQADVDLNGSANAALLVQIFDQRGLIDASSLGPIISHQPLSTVEQLGGTVPISTIVTGTASSVERVFAVYSYDDAPADTLELATNGGNNYAGAFPLPEVAGQVSYFIGAVDGFGLSVRDPLSSNQFYTFEVGPDSEPPVITHNQLSSVSLIDWPAMVEVTVEDNLGVDSVEVQYRIDGPFGNLIEEGVFGLEQDGDTYSGVFPTALEILEPGSTVCYQFKATDISMAQNVSLDPVDGYHGFNIIIEDGIFRQYDFESPISQLQATGQWERGEPAYGVRIAHSEAMAWATNVDGAYVSAGTSSRMTLPLMNLREFTDAYLVFWHWYDTEHGGEAGPDSDSTAIVWDGGNIKVSSDGGATWSVVSPSMGYNGHIASGRNNPLDGEPVFGGFSYGWRQEIVALPVGDEILVAFDFGTDEGNTNDAPYAGWYIDDVRVLTELSNDTQVPRALQLPDPIISIESGQAIPAFKARLFDEVGIESVQTEYTVYTSSSTVEMGEFRVAMDSTSLYDFTGFIPDPFERSLQVGDSITYRFVVQDFDGNQAIFPPESTPPLRIEYRLNESVDLLDDVRGSGLWEMAEEGWGIGPGSTFVPLSSLVSGPIDLPSNVDTMAIRLRFSYAFEGDHGGNLKISTTGGANWDVLSPTTGYNNRLPDNAVIPEQLRGQPVFSGRTISDADVSFGVASYKGQQVWFRLDFGAVAPLQESEFWQVDQMALSYSTLETVNGGFDVAWEFALHENYPDPFSTSTTISYTLPEATPVFMGVYDILGRRVAILVDEAKQAGTYTLNFEAAQLSSGVYLLRLETNQAQEVERMIIAK